MAMRKRVVDLLQVISSSSCKCPAHSNLGLSRGDASVSNAQPTKEYAFEMACSTIRYGRGVTKEVGMDIVNMNAKKVCVMTDPNLINLSPAKETLDSLTKNLVEFEVYDSVRVEPTEQRYLITTEFRTALQYAESAGWEGHSLPREQLKKKFGIAGSK